MQQEQSVAAPASFAGLMAALTAARAQASGVSAAEDGLEDDVATLSYARALKAHARYRPAAEPSPAIPEGPMRKNASITVRMSKAEYAQLQQRAAEAGMTVSAYLRSCTLEVESLRAQVKQTLAELRTAQTDPPRPARLQWLRGLRRKAAG